MDAQLILVIILGLITFDFLLDQILKYLNFKNLRIQLPEELNGIYSEEKYARSLSYQKENTRIGFLSGFLGFILSFVIILSGFLGDIDGYLRLVGIPNDIVPLVFFGVLMIGSDILSLPFQWYRTFVIEEKYGFNKTTRKLFFVDKLKGYLLSAILGGGLLFALIQLINHLGSDFWIYFLVLIVAFIIITNMFYTSLILPLFNKLTPLQDGELKSEINAYSEKINFPIHNIFVIDGSKRSNKANAFFSGLGKRKKVVLYDTLINNHSIEELVAVLAHEVGHYKKKHIVWSMILAIGQVSVMLFIMSKLIFSENLSLALGAEQWGIHLNLLTFAILYSPISRLTGVIMNVLSRKNEFEADAYATTTYNGDALKIALKKLSVDNLSNLLPHGWYVFFNYSHPPLLQRLKAIDLNQKQLS